MPSCNIAAVHARFRACSGRCWRRRWQACCRCEQDVTSDRIRAGWTAWFGTRSISPSRRRHRFPAGWSYLIKAANDESSRSRDVGRWMTGRRDCTKNHVQKVTNLRQTFRKSPNSRRCARRQFSHIVFAKYSLCGALFSHRSEYVTIPCLKDVSPLACWFWYFFW